MTYLLISIPFLVVAAVVARVGWPRGSSGSRGPGAGRRRAGRRRAVATSAAAAVLLVLTAVFDTLIIAAGIVAYDEDRRSGVTIGLAPVEDFLYPIAGVLLLPAVWSLFARRRAGGSR
ncbi:lycopene cyclase domain-containing protein [Agromyces marinus]|uniref:Lycopene cyclase domain-containing protein n=1 Tax=Agromyces marinus TaxID=1389020 RepID=A0ABM8GY35_9MICO|nr:lycopene cyclase domain-containing protein [Agromyces marinus]UIP58399.1 hypothetical protein DSM26151_12740 [Agromyces marinus]BDZ53347.1 hypothetical protein GCM10025870_04200 [Agromyces marinus]